MEILSAVSADAHGANLAWGNGFMQDKAYASAQASLHTYPVLLARAGCLTELSADARVANLAWENGFMHNKACASALPGFSARERSKKRQRKERVYT